MTDNKIEQNYYTWKMDVNPIFGMAPGLIKKKPNLNNQMTEINNLYFTLIKVLSLV